jgi:hypothetical protein
MPETFENSQLHRRLIVNADDFGLSHSVNAAVIRAHREGILTTASLMVNEAGFEEAVKLARENPQLGVGLHLTLLQGHSTLPPKKIPGLVNARGEFPENPVGTGMKYFFRRSLRKSARNLRSFIPPACRSTTSTAICTCICIRRFSEF